MDLRREKQQLAELNLFFGCCKRVLENTGARGAPDDSGTTAAVFSCSVQLQCSGELARRGHQGKEVLPPTVASCPI